MHRLIVSPFLDGYLAVRPGSTVCVRLPASHYEDLRQYARVDDRVPDWLAATATEAWDLDLDGQSCQEALLVREPTELAFARASWEINLYCNFGCKHCYLGERPLAGLGWDDKVKLIDIFRDSGVLWLQITGGEPTVDPDFEGVYRYAYRQGMMLTVLTNASRLWKPELLRLFRDCPPYRVVVTMYGATEDSFDELTQRKGAWKNFRKGMAAARNADLPLRVSVVVTEDNAHEVDAMAALVESWGLDYHVYTNMQPTFSGTGEPLLVQSTEHLRKRPVFQGCNAGVTFFHADPHARVSIWIGRDDQIDLMAEGIDGLRRLGAISDRLMLRTGGCPGCSLSGTCRVCRPLAKLYQEAKAPLNTYCQHGDTKEMVPS
ncbi:radical SAM protein [Streptomyces sp. TRM68416]|uniref:radical SAM protein n=1 Tax=Streptomyces sp. TRM68416 TaxID=2758412 RepID=UPI001661D160|nr:radical SAM protein [Streptomyces sp. TRM68416]MBD0842008.1 radical SAM protein [Streptomyces sp. TRM68416]